MGYPVVKQKNEGYLLWFIEKDNNIWLKEEGFYKKK